MMPSRQLKIMSLVFLMLITQACKSPDSDSDINDLYNPNTKLLLSYRVESGYSKNELIIVSECRDVELLTFSDCLISPRAINLKKFKSTLATKLRPRQIELSTLIRQEKNRAWDSLPQKLATEADIATLYKEQESIDKEFSVTNTHDRSRTMSRFYNDKKEGFDKEHLVDLRAWKKKYESVVLPAKAILIDNPNDKDALEFLARFEPKLKDVNDELLKREQEWESISSQISEKIHRAETVSTEIGKAKTFRADLYKKFRNGEFDSTFASKIADFENEQEQLLSKIQAYTDAILTKIQKTKLPIEPSSLDSLHQKMLKEDLPTIATTKDNYTVIQINSHRTNFVMKSGNGFTQLLYKKPLD